MKQSILIFMTIAALHALTLNCIALHCIEVGGGGACKIQKTDKKANEIEGSVPLLALHH